MDMLDMYLNKKSTKHFENTGIYLRRAFVCACIILICLCF